MDGLQGVAAAADAQRPHAVSIHAREGGNDVCHAVNILYPEGRIIQISWQAAAGPLKGGICRYGDVAVFRQFLGIKAGHLLLDAAIGMSHDNGRIFFAIILGIASRGVDIGGNQVAVQPVADGMDIYPARLVFSNGILINKAKGVGVRALRRIYPAFLQVTGP